MSDSQIVDILENSFSLTTRITFKLLHVATLPLLFTVVKDGSIMLLLLLPKLSVDLASKSFSLSKLTPVGFRQIRLSVILRHVDRRVDRDNSALSFD